MRVLHVCSGDLWAGAEVAVFHLAAELARRTAVDISVLLLNEGRLANGLREAGIETWVVPESRLGFVQILGKSNRILRSWRPDVVHSHRYKENVIAVVLAAAVDAKHVRTVHGMPAPGLASVLDGALGDWTGSEWIAVSADLARSAQGLRRRVSVVPNGLPKPPARSARDTLDAAFGDRAPARYVGLVGRVEQVKRPDRFLRIVSWLPEMIDGASVRGVVVGDGTLSAEMTALAERLGLGQRVRFLGHRDDGEEIVAALDALVISSDHEGVPMVLLEAMRSGVPVVASRVGGIPEVIADPAWVLSPDDEPAMSRALTALLTSLPLREAWSRQLRARFDASCSIEVMADRVLDVYRTAGGGP